MDEVVYRAELRSAYGILTSKVFTSLEEAVVHLVSVTGRVWPAFCFWGRIIRVVNGASKEDVLPGVLADLKRRCAELVDSTAKDG